MVRVVNKDLKRQKILEAAMRVFAKQGISKTKMIHVAEEAGIGKGTIYEYFRSKEEIFGAGLEFFFSSMNAEIERQIEPGSDPEKHLRKMMEISIDFFSKTGKEFTALMVDFWADGLRQRRLEPVATRRITEIYEDYIEYISRLLISGEAAGLFTVPNKRLAASLFIASLDGIVLQSMMMPDLIRLEDIKTELIDQLLRIVKTA